MLIFTIKPGDLGDCAKCLRKPAKHKVYHKFDTPIRSDEIDDFPPIDGVWEFLCDDCVPSNLSLT